MAEYTPSYTKPYTEGFVNAPPYDTPITAEVLNAIDNAISAIEKYLSGNPIEKGTDGVRGSRWNIGTAITGTSTTATVFNETGITDALVNDIYLNISEGNIYRCTTSGDANTAEWVYEGNIKETSEETGESGGSSIDLTNLVVTNSISLGRKTNTTIGAGSIAEGESVTASGKNSHSEGSGTTASGFCAHSEGSGTNAGYCAHAEGYNTTASGSDSHAEGASTKAQGSDSHAEGAGTVASASGSHAEGYMTTASNGYAHAEGYSSQAKAVASHAEGFGTLANTNYQHVQGKYNVEDTENKYAHIVGNGSSTARANAHTLDWEGNAWYAGNVESKGMILTDTEDSTKRYLIQITNGQLVATEITATA